MGTQKAMEGYGAVIRQEALAAWEAAEGGCVDHPCFQRIVSLIESQSVEYRKLTETLCIIIAELGPLVNNAGLSKRCISEAAESIRATASACLAAQRKIKGEV